MSSCGSSEKRVWKKIKSAVLELLESKQTFCALLVVWMAQGLFAYLVYPPGDDLGEYLTSALGVKNWLQNGMFYGNAFTYKYYLQPGFALFHGLFFKVLSVLGIALDYYTYRLPHILTVLAVIVSSIVFFSLVNRKNGSKAFLFNSNVFLIILGITPFVQNCWVVRPEVLGVLFLVLALCCYACWQGGNCQHKVPFFMVGFFMGLSGTLHLNFVVMTAPVALFICIQRIMRGNRLDAFLFAVFWSLPSVAVLGWYFVHLPESWQELGTVLFEQKTSYGSTYGAGLIRIFKDAMMLNPYWDSFGKRAYYAFFTIPIAVALLFFPLTWKKVFSDPSEKYGLKLVAMLLITSILTLIIDRKGMYSYLTNTAALIAIFWSMFLTKVRRKDSIRGPRKVLKMTLIVFCMVASTESLVHGAKYLVSSKKYFYVPRVHEEVIKKMKLGDTLFVTQGKLIAPFFGLFNAQFGAKPKVKVYHLFSKTYLEKTSVEMEKWLYKKMTELPAESTIWGLSKGRIRHGIENGRCGVNISVTNHGINLEFTIKDIIYEDSYYVFFRPEVTEIVEAQELEN